jgi:hypothetical protein
MCLELLSDEPKQLRNYKAGVGWKVFDKSARRPNALYFEFQIHNGRAIVPRGKWLASAKGSRTFTPCQFAHDGRMRDIAYPPRFHIYLRRKRAESGMKCIRVQFKDPVATGYEGYDPIVVASKLFVPKEKKRVRKSK